MRAYDMHGSSQLNFAPLTHKDRMDLIGIKSFFQTPYKDFITTHLKAINNKTMDCRKKIQEKIEKKLH